MINAERPDLVLIAGDIIDISIRPLEEENVAEEFRRIKAPIYACLGNWGGKFRIGTRSEYLVATITKSF